MTGILFAMAGRAGGIRQGLVFAVILAVTSAFAAADPDNGERRAQRWCAACHVVASDQRGPTGEAPPFATMHLKRAANRREKRILRSLRPKLNSG
jgi:mono/diheme cytochrome c family protein